MSSRGIEDIYNLGIHAENQEGEVGEESRTFPVLPPSPSVHVTLWKKIGRMSPGDLVKMERTSALLLRSIHCRIGMLQ